MIADARGRVHRMASDARGNVAMIFALTLPVLILMTFGGIDLHRMSTVRVNLQDALDAASLAAARSAYVDDENLTRIGRAALRANLAGHTDVQVDDSELNFSLVDEKVVVGTARVRVKTIAAHVFLPPYGQLMDDWMPVSTRSEVARASKNIEVALVLDVTGSMGNSGRMAALKAAATNLINIVVQPPAEQTPFYSRVAIVPYSIGVNAGSYANATRGSLRGPTAITNARWSDDTAKTIAKVDKKSNAAKVTTSTNHGLVNGDYVWVTGASDVPSTFNDKIYRVTRLNDTQFSLNGYNNTSNKDGSGGTVQKCIRSDCTVIVTASTHGLQTGDYTFISDVRGMTGLNNSADTDTTCSACNWQIELVSVDEFRVNLKGPAQNAYTSGGYAQCGLDGCLFRIAKRADDKVERVESSTCVSDRAGSAAYTDAAPGTNTWVGRLYPISDPCSSRPVTPLSADKDDLLGEIDDLQPTGSTAGQIGFAWGWYMLSPNFNSIWSGNPAGAYDPYRTVKAIILMTDGEFNTTYCQGELAKNANYADTRNRINCDATNGNPFAQTARLCSDVKNARKQGEGLDKTPAVVIYTVGLSVSNSRGGAGIDTAREVLESCASGSARAKFATNATQLADAFEEFAQDITRLRIAK